MMAMRISIMTVSLLSLIFLRSGAGQHVGERVWS